MSLLGRITEPTDLKGLPTAALAVLAEEIRAFLIDKVSGVGGHLGPNLGVVELTIAAHRVFDSPREVLLFDTGHQAYVHKILTGRCVEFDSLRQAGGLSGYPIAEGPTVIRYPKAAAGPDISAIGRIGHCHLLRDDPAAQGLLIAVGPLADPCLAAADELAAHDVPVTVIDPRWIAPLDPALLKLAGAHRLVLTIEDTTSTGALGARIAQALAVAGADTCAATFALPPRFQPPAFRDQILRAHGLDAAGIATAVLKRLTSTHRGKVTCKEN